MGEGTVGAGTGVWLLRASTSLARPATALATPSAIAAADPPSGNQEWQPWLGSYGAVGMMILSPGSRSVHHSAAVYLKKWAAACVNEGGDRHTGEQSQGGRRVLESTWLQLGRSSGGVC